MANALLLNGVDDGVGDIFVYTGGQAPRDVRRARIADSIDTIAEYAFRDCEQLIEVEGHDKLKKIEGSAFHQCRSLRRVTKMGGVKEIQWGAFLGCYALSHLELDKLEFIGLNAFSYCESLRSINVPSIRIIGASAFWGCERLTEAVFGEGLERIVGCAFNQCTALIRIAIPLKHNLIYEDAESFRECGNLSRVDVIGGIHKTISSLHLETWRDEMMEEIDRINQTLPITSVGKGAAIQQWIRSVIDRRDHYKTVTRSY